MAMATPRQPSIGDLRGPVKQLNPGRAHFPASTRRWLLQTIAGSAGICQPAPGQWAANVARTAGSDWALTRGKWAWLRLAGRCKPSPPFGKRPGFDGDTG